MSYYTINEDAARLSKELSSFSDYKAGSATASYRAQVDEAAATLEKVKALCTTEAQRDRAEYLFDRYAATLAQAINRDNEIGTRCPSVMISGPANFPTRKKEKQLAAGRPTPRTTKRPSITYICWNTRTNSPSNPTTPKCWKPSPPS